MKKGKRYLLISIFIIVFSFYLPDTAAAMAPESVSESSLHVESVPEGVPEQETALKPVPKSPSEKEQPSMEPAFVLPPPEPVETPEPDEEPDTISSAAELTGWLESHKYSGGRASLTGDITMNESYVFVPYPNMPPLSVETGKYTIFVCADAEFWSDGQLTFSGEGGERGIFHVQQGGTLLVDGVNVETTAGGSTQHALWQEEGAGMILGNTYASCRVSGDVHYAEAPLVTEAENVCVVVEKGELLDDHLPREVTCKVNARGVILEHEPVAVSWDMEGTEKQQEERLRFQAQGVLPQAADGVKPVCTVVYNDFPLTFTSVEALIRGAAYMFRGSFTRQEGALAAVVLPEYSFDGENWIGEGENGTFNADSDFCIAFPCGCWDVSSNPHIYIRLRGEAGQQVYYSNVLRYAANNMDTAEDLGGSRGGGTSIVNPPEEPVSPEKPGESGKPEESDSPGEAEKSETPGKPNEPQKPVEPKKPAGQEKVNEPDTQDRAPESGKPEQPAESEEPVKSEEPIKSEETGGANIQDKTEPSVQAPEPAETKTGKSTVTGQPDQEEGNGAAHAQPAEVRSEPLAQTESGHVEAGQTENYGLMVGIVVLSAAAGAVCFSVSKSRGTKR